MGFMFVLTALHGHVPLAVTTGHGHGRGWVMPALTIAVVVLSVLCATGATAALCRMLATPGAGAQRVRTERLAVILGCASAAAMVAMTGHLLVS